nr:protein cortex-like [Megalopta genalis]
MINSTKKMRRIHLPLQNQEIEVIAENVDGTPIATGLCRFPRLRLLDKILRSDDYTTCTIVNSRSPTLKYVGNTKKFPASFPKSVSAADRFIVSRKEYNMDAANYLLTRKTTTNSSDDDLDLPKEISMLNVKWRKDQMHRAMVKENVIQGLGQKEVLHHNRLPGIVGTQPGEMWNEQYAADGMWRSKPRNKPLISNAGLIFDMPDTHRRTQTNRNLIDWSSKNMIAEAIHNKVTIFEATQPQLGIHLNDVNAARVCILKWNNAGDQIVICTFLASIKLHDIELGKNIWTITCNKAVSTDLSCYARCVCWSHDDKSIVVGCMQLITIYCAKTGQMVNSVVAHSDEILTIAMSMNSYYIATSSTDRNIRIFRWPSLNPALDIAYRYQANAVAWHPYHGSLLCVGGGLSDASVSLFDVASNVVGHRTVDFFGSVDNLAWNKHSGELVVHWTQVDEDGEYTIVPVFASIDRIVDAVPVNKESRVSSVMWNADHTQIAVYNAESLTVWNFFGDEYQYHDTCRKQREPKYKKRLTRHRGLNSIHHFIR